MLSNTSKYAIRAVIYLALYASPEKRYGIKEIAEELNLPTPFLGKILQNLARNGVLDSAKGPGGGFCLKKSALDISVMEVIEIIDGPGAFTSCLIRTENCSTEHPCSLHDKVTSYRTGLKKVLQTESIADLVSEFRHDSKRIRI